MAKGGKGKDIGKSVDDLRKRVEDLEKQVKGTLKKCAPCKGSGFQLDEDGKPSLDRNGDPRICPVCQGKAWVRV